MIRCIKIGSFSFFVSILLVLAAFDSGFGSPLNDGGIIRGRILDRNGNPLSGGQVVFYKAPFQACDSVRASTSGRFEASLESGSYYVAASAFNYCRQLFPDAYLFEDAEQVYVLSNEVKEIEFDLTSGGMISGYVFTGNYESTEFLITAVKADDPDEGWQSTQRFQVNYHGDYCLDGLLPGYYRVFAIGDQYQTIFYPNVQTYDEAELVEVNAGEVSSNINFEMMRPGNGTISGTVLDISTFQPIAGAEVSAYQWQNLEEDPNNARTMTDENGEFELELTSGYYYIMAAMAHFTRAGNIIRIYYDGHYDAVLANPVFVGADEHIQGIDFDVDLSHNFNLQLSGELDDRDSGMPIRGASVTAIDYYSGVPLSTCRSHPDGSFSIEHLPSGGYLVEVAGGGVVPTFWPSALGWQQADIIVMSDANQILHNGGAITQDYGTPGFSISGHVSGPDGPLMSARVYAINSDDGSIACGLTNAGGYYQIASGLYDGRYLIFADLYGWNGAYYPDALQLDLIYRPVFEGIDFELSPATVSVATEENLPGETALVGNYPNPFNSCTVIMYSTDKISNTQLEIYNLGGQLVDAIPILTKPGLNEFIWDGRSLDGNKVASGVYFYKIADLPEIRKMVLLK